MTARIFQSSKFTYSFPASPGPKFLRLYFNPASYSNLDKTRSFFSVSANNFTLLTNFSAFLTVSAKHPSAPVVVKEFIVNVLNSHHLNVTFIPSSSSYAFINGIEIVSMPNNLYLRDQDSDESAATFVNFQPLVCSVNTTALETMYRLNVGGQVIPDVEDTGMFRTWKNDEDYIYGESRWHLASPDKRHNQVLQGHPCLYSTEAGVQHFPDNGLHLCETQLEVTKVNQRVFRVFIYNQTAEEAADVIQWSGGTGIPVYKDYLVWVPKKIQGKQDLWLALHPNRDLNPEPEFADAILNGVEIFKLNQSEGSLAGPNPELVVGPTSGFPKEETENKNKNEVSPPMILIGTIGGASFAMLCNLFLLAYWQRRRKRTEESGTSFPKSSWVPFSKYWWSTSENVSSLPLKLSRYFSIAEIKAATRNFDNRLVIGAGGFGNVYKGHIQDESTVVAIKRLNPSSRQGTREFWTEIQMLSSLRHVNLVALLGYCDDLDEMILVYEYVARGTLRDHLYKSKNPPLTWKQRLQICIHAARGLNFLHTGAKQMIIHRDVKATNILLDENLTAKVSDFGLSKLGPDSRSQTHVTTVVKGSLGYVDPEYYRRQRLTEKSDVYSFGVVLFEVLCARPAMMPGLPKEQVSLAHWARKSYQSGTLDGIIDPFLKGKIAPECLNKFGEIADSCLT
ncbi:Receptor-like protein kinase FERONIA [Morella rubra]|uniref:Receptor-like protein kinase FERONIA n=1 Tax=Morella rubra TaxID=262757 RepID=A0A6A1VGX5_9ROSI|nr:Receptor-like protein kinase FERONIA [Morella rubra]